MPAIMQVEVIKCLQTLEIAAHETNKAIDIKRIKQQYLILAQKYHPDVLAQNAREAAEAAEAAGELEGGNGNDDGEGAASNALL